VGSGEDWDIIEAALGSGISIRSGAKRFVADLKSRSVLICQAIHATARTPRWLLVTDEVAVRCGRRGQRRLAVGTRFSMTRLPRIVRLRMTIRSAQAHCAASNLVQRRRYFGMLQVPAKNYKMANQADER
jgi:hypothetical protein